MLVIVMLVEIEMVLMIMIAYVVGLMSVMFFIRYRSGRQQTLAEYESRFREYEEMLVDMRIRVDMLEIRSRTESSQPPSQAGSDVSDTSHMQPPRSIRRNLEQEGKDLVEYVLKLLSDGPKTTREIETIIGRSREHTARLMKKLFEMGHVTRDTSTKPYTYAISDSGRSMMEQAPTQNTGESDSN